MSSSETEGREFKLREAQTRFMGTRYDVQIIFAGRHVGWKEFATREAAEAFIASRT